MNESIDALQLNLGDGGLLAMNISLAFIMFGVALELTVGDFRRLSKEPKSTLVGIFSQFVFLPAITLLLVLFFEPHPSMALGMFMVAACPGGNISNFFSLLAKGNAALSVSMTAIATLAAIVITPFNFTLWASMYGPTNVILKEIHINLWEVFKIIGLILGLPLFFGMMVRHFREQWASKIANWIKGFGVIFFSGFVLVAFAMNFDNFINYVHLVIGLVFFHNAFALTGGYGLASLFNLPEPDRKSIAIETGIQNSGLGLLLIFNFFDGLGGMALVAAWWGIWHIITGLGIGWYWSMGKSALQRVISNA
ncbi:bile acid:sodium symporter family protein [Aliifodinibius sp. S!AR15-10]|uniref:bile acid:sodium symporter family protein n=1 Tax=Aliifodinibius sp. S!AR15-10 TaxID=2950437 RepID=UPI002866DCC0|nr:bile acid:sodium symporter family protein [Aliifodinibius sp. S!AR15-10]MDR8392694.1 bile acid:sodium symporter family protein [Aliifodinibius sp. S!AR15-10]